MWVDDSICISDLVSCDVSTVNYKQHVLRALYSLGPAAIWPSVPLIVKPHLQGSAYGLLTALLNLITFVYPVGLTPLQSSGPDGTRSIIYALFASAFLAVAASLWLWFVDRRQGAPLEHTVVLKLGTAELHSEHDEHSELLRKEHDGDHTQAGPEHPAEHDHDHPGLAAALMDREPHSAPPTSPVAHDQILLEADSHTSDSSKQQQPKRSPVVRRPSLKVILSGQAAPVSDLSGGDGVDAGTPEPDRAGTPLVSDDDRLLAGHNRPSSHEADQHMFDYSGDGAVMDSSPGSGRPLMPSVGDSSGAVTGSTPPRASHEATVRLGKSGNSDIRTHVSKSSTGTGSLGQLNVVLQDARDATSDGSAQHMSGPSDTSFIAPANASAVRLPSSTSASSRIQLLSAHTSAAGDTGQQHQRLVSRTASNLSLASGGLSASTAVSQGSSTGTSDDAVRTVVVPVPTVLDALRSNSKFVDVDPVVLAS